MKPVYCNTASITHNAKTGEVSLSFSHLYTEHNLSAAAGGLTDVSAKVVEEEAHVIMSKEGFLSLKHLVDNVWEKMNEG